ncbi:beta strand repeat-containing protein [Haloferula sargassicola]|uniref:Autotransporter-associated beta strand repeat-containing protein n=1 Tax=Haloferula sargassicola TaxID=490096 RepID=A0ABP9UUU8_9BACT
MKTPPRRYPHARNLDRSLKSPASLLLAIALSGGALPAATIFWDGGTSDIAGNGDGASAGGNGTWNNTLLNWDAGNTPHVAWTSGDSAIFGGSGGSVTLGTAISAGNVSLGNANYTIATDGGALTLTGGLTTTSNYHQIAGVGGLVVSGDQIFNIGSGTRISTVVSGSGTITKTGGGMLSFNNGFNSFTGKIIVNEGRFGINGDGALGAVPGTFVADSITLNGGGLVSGIVNNAGGGFDNGGVFTLNANRGITLGASNGSIQVGYGSDGRMTIAGAITGVGSLTKTDGGTLSLLGNNTYQGGTTISGGALSVGEMVGNSSNEGSNNSLGSGDVSVAGGAQLVLAGNNLTIGNNITLNGAATVHGRQGALVGGLQDGNSANKLTGTLTLAGTGNRSVSTWWSDKTLELAGKVTGTGTLQVLNIRADGSGGGSIVILSNNTNDYSGGTVIEAGSNPTLRLAANEVIPDGAGKGNVTVNGRLEVNGFTETVNGLSGSGSIALGNNASLSVGNNDAGGTFSGRLFGASTSVLRKIGNGTFTLSGNGDNGDARARVDAGVLVLGKDSSSGVHALGSGGGSDYALNITGGTARLGGTGGDQIYQNSAVNMTGGTFDLAGLSEGFDGLSGTSGTVTNSVASTTSTLTLGQNNSVGSPTFAGTIENGAGTVALVKTGTGTQTLSGNNTFTGDTSITGGTLLVNGSHASANTTVSSGATLGGDGSLAGTTTIQSGGIHAPGNGPGVQSFTNLTYDNGSIFSWEIDRTLTQTRGTGYDAVDVSGTLSGGGSSIFRVVIGDADFSDSFWTSSHTWSDIFTTDGSTPVTNWANYFVGGFQYYNTSGNVIGAPTTGSFSLAGNTLSFSAVPETSNALAGLLLAAGLVHRRRTR